MSVTTDFLQALYPAGPWVLTAIEPGRKGIETRTFTDKSAVTKWLKKYNGEWNVYYSVNPPIKAVSKKCEREDIKEVAYLHIDLDPRKDDTLKTDEEKTAHLEAERKRILATLSEPPHGIPPPTFLVFSGGGYNALWKLKEPIPVNGDMELAEDAKRWSLQLEILLSADNVHNIDRILRLPGTMNVPDAKKRKQGRVPIESSIEFYEKDRVYPLDKFTQAQPVQMQEMTSFAGSGTPTAQVHVQAPTNVDFLADVHDLDEWSVPDRTKVIIVQGSHPDEGPKGVDNSRSGWLFDVLCSLVRCGVPDTIIWAVITDPDFGISSSVLDKAPNVQKYASRQISRAKEEAIDPWLRRLNEKYAVVMNIGGKCRVIEEVVDPAIDRPRLTRITFEDFRNSWMHERVQVGLDSNGTPKSIPAGKWWLEQRERRQYKSIIFSPGKDVEGCYNLWTGFAVTAKPGDCQPFLDHMRENVCNGNEEHYNYLLGWMANTVQEPGTPGHVAVVMRGAMGTGKSFFAKEFGALFGRHFLPVSDPKHLTGSFNYHLRDCVLLFGDEAFYAGDKKHESVLKALVTEDTVAIESKGVDVENNANCTHIMLASNKDWIVPAGPGERRYFVLDVGDAHKRDHDYFKELAAHMQSGGREALLHLLLTMDLSEFEVRSAPNTSALREQQELSFGVEEDWWYKKLEEGHVLEGDQAWPSRVARESLTDDFINHTRRFNVPRRGTETSLGRFVKKMCPGLRTVRETGNVVVIHDGEPMTLKKRAYFYRLPSLAACRELWENKHGETQWQNDMQDEIRLTDDGSDDGIPF